MRAEFLSDKLQNTIVKTLLEYAGLTMEQVWFTPLVGCPVVNIPPSVKQPPDAVAVPKNVPIDACSARIQEEVRIIEPHIVVAFGQAAARSLIKKNAPSIHYNLGEVHEGLVQGVLCTFPVPVLLTYSTHALIIEPDYEQDNGVWAKTAGHIALAARIASFMEEAREVQKEHKKAAHPRLSAG